LASFDGFKSRILTDFRADFADFFFAGMFVSFLLLFVVVLKPPCGVGPHCGSVCNYLSLSPPIPKLPDELAVWPPNALVRLVVLLDRRAPPFVSFDGLRSRTFTSFFFFAVAILLLFLFVGCLINVSHAEQISTPAQDVFFWDQVIESDQFILLALLLSSPGLSSRHIFFSFRRTHVSYLLPPFVPPGFRAEKSMISIARKSSYLVGKQTS
jgi:hypothetical protein